MILPGVDVLSCGLPPFAFAGCETFEGEGAFGAPFDTGAAAVVDILEEKGRRQCEGKERGPRRV